MASSSSSLTIQEAAQVMNFCRETEEVDVLGTDFEVSKEDFATYYRRLKGLPTDGAANREFNKIDENYKGSVTVEEICAFYELDGEEVTREAQILREASDVKVLEALQGRIVLQNRVRREKLANWREKIRIRKEITEEREAAIKAARDEEGENEAPADQPCSTGELVQALAED
jgi:hypothetical protein